MDTQNGATMSLEEQYQSALSLMKKWSWARWLADGRTREEMEKDYPELKAYNEALAEVERLEKLLGK